MKPVKAILKNTFAKRSGNVEKITLNAGKEVLILGKWNGFGKSETGYLVYDPEHGIFLELDSGHLNPINKNNVKYNLPIFAYGALRDKISTYGEENDSFPIELIHPEGESTLTIGKRLNELVIVIGVINDFKYPSGAAYILSKPKQKISDSAFIVDSLEVKIITQGNMVII